MHYKNDSSWKNGQKVEKDFEKILKREGVSYEVATQQQQYNHIDFITDHGTMDVKGMKKNNRRDAFTQNEQIWIEILNVQGKKGWVCSDVDFITFERENDFITVRRSALEKMVREKCDLQDRVYRPQDALYKGYRREGRKDLITKVLMTDILNLHRKEWAK